jgi:hypothetical protein
MKDPHSIAIELQQKMVLRELNAFSTAKGQVEILTMDLKTAKRVLFDAAARLEKAEILLEKMANLTKEQFIASGLGSYKMGTNRFSHRSPGD